MLFKGTKFVYRLPFTKFTIAYYIILGSTLLKCCGLSEGLPLQFHKLRNHQFKWNILMSDCFGLICEVRQSTSMRKNELDQPESILAEFALRLTIWSYRFVTSLSTSWQKVALPTRSAYKGLKGCFINLEWEALFQLLIQGFGRVTVHFWEILYGGFLKMPGRRVDTGRQMWSLFRHMYCFVLATVSCRVGWNEDTHVQAYCLARDTVWIRTSGISPSLQRKHGFDNMDQWMSVVLNNAFAALYSHD